MYAIQFLGGALQFCATLAFVALLVGAAFECGASFVARKFSRPN